MLHSLLRFENQNIYTNEPNYCQLPPLFTVNYIVFDPDPGQSTSYVGICYHFSINLNTIYFSHLCYDHILVQHNLELMENCVSKLFTINQTMPIFRKLHVKKGKIIAPK